MADFLTRLAERTLNRVPVAQPMIASVFAPEPTLPGFLPQAEAWSPLEQTQEVTAVSPAVPEIEVQSAINARQEVPTPFTPITPKPSPIIAEQEEQAGARPGSISQDKAAKPGRRGDHKGHSYNEESDAGVQGDHKGRPYNDESSAIPSQSLITDQPPALTGQLSLYPAPAAPGLPVEENEPGIAAKHEANDPMRMKMEHTEIVSPVADIASLIEASVGISPVEIANTRRREDTTLSVEADGGEEHSYPMVRQRRSPGEEGPGMARVEEGWMSHPIGINLSRE
jgi:hypothetical protein